MNRKSDTTVCTQKNATLSHKTVEIRDAFLKQ